MRQPQPSSQKAAEAAEAAEHKQPSAEQPSICDLLYLGPNDLHRMTALQPSNSVPVLVNKRNHEHHEPILHCSVQKWIWIDNSNRKIQKHGIQKLGFNTQHDSMSLPPSEGLSAAQPAWIFLMAMRTGTSLASILTQSAWANGGWLEKVPGYPHFSTYQKNISG